MKYCLKLAFFLLVIIPCMPARAQEIPVPPPQIGPATAVPSVMPDGEVVSEALCFNVINRAPYRVYGSVMTNLYTAPDGTKSHHRSNFRLDPAEQTQFCSYGPFFAGRRVELTLRTLVPIFSCKTVADRDVVIYGREKPAGGTQTWAVCY